MANSDDHDGAKPQQLKLFGRSFVLPRSRLARIGVGVALIIGGIFGFLPILGFWMVPLGIIILSQDLPAVRRFKRRIWVRVNRRWARRKDEGK